MPFDLEDKACSNITMRVKVIYLRTETFPGTPLHLEIYPRFVLEPCLCFG